jgi:trehalose 2-sulfotransferase
MADSLKPKVPVDTLYVIASTMRTGSYLLCEGLYAAGAGNPREVFCPERRDNYCGEWELPPNTSFEEYLRAVMRDGTTPNGVCGMKIHWHHVEPLARRFGILGKPWRIMPMILPNARYIHLTRRDRRAQAISWYRAKITNEWYRIPGAPQRDLTGDELQFDATQIHRMEIELAEQDRDWEELFAEYSILPFRMNYEKLASDYVNEVASALEFLGQDPAIAKKLPPPRLVRQRDAISDEWQQHMDEEFPLKG